MAEHPAAGHIHAAITDGMARLNAQIEAAAADLPDPPEGYRWVLHYGPATLADAEAVANTVSVALDAEFRLEEAAGE